MALPAAAQAQTQQVSLLRSHIATGNLVSFQTDSAQIDPQSFPVLNEVAQILASNPSVTLEIQVHSDERGSSAYNERLTQERARSIYDYLVQAGVNATRLSHRGYGEACPVDNGHNAGAWQRNRRVIFFRTDATVTFQCSPATM